MGAREFDNIATRDLRFLLHEDTTLKRFYPLIPYGNQLIYLLESANVKDKYDFIARYDASRDGFSNETRISLDMLDLTNGLFHLHDFKNRKLSELTSFDADYIRELKARGNAYSGDCLRTGCGKERLMRFCDLMRLPGVKEIRAELYYESGYRGTRDFIGQTAAGMHKSIAEHIEKSGSGKSLPLPKELSTQIAVATVIPRLDF